MLVGLRFGAYVGDSAFALQLSPLAWLRATGLKQYRKLQFQRSEKWFLRSGFYMSVSAVKFLLVLYVLTFTVLFYRHSTKCGLFVPAQWSKFSRAKLGS